MSNKEVISSPEPVSPKVRKGIGRFVTAKLQSREAHPAAKSTPEKHARANFSQLVERAASTGAVLATSSVEALERLTDERMHNVQLDVTDRPQFLRKMAELAFASEEQQKGRKWYDDAMVFEIASLLSNVEQPAFTTKGKQHLAFVSPVEKAEVDLLHQAVGGVQESKVADIGFWIEAYTAQGAERPQKEAFTQEVSQSAYGTPDIIGEISDKIGANFPEGVQPGNEAAYIGFLDQIGRGLLEEHTPQMVGAGSTTSW